MGLECDSLCFELENFAESEIIFKMGTVVLTLLSSCGDQRLDKFLTTCLDRVGIKNKSLFLSPRKLRQTMTLP